MTAVPKEVAAFRTVLEKTSPRIAVHVDEPYQGSGRWWIDLTFDGAHTALSWKRGVGFEFYRDEETSFGAKPMESIGSVEAAIARATRPFVSLGMKPIRFHQIQSTGGAG